jgi:hypothetical protein
MSSKREQILAHIATTLAGTVGVSSRIYRSRVEAFARNESGAIVIEYGRDTAQTYSTCKLDWTLQVLIAVYFRGAIPDQLADATIVSLHSKLMADRTLGNRVMDIIPTSVDPQLEKADQPAAWIVCAYEVRYRTMADNLES